jgi:hypothetical protein
MGQKPQIRKNNQINESRCITRSPMG